MELYFELTAKPPRITDEKGRLYTSFQARALVDAGKVTHCNLAFRRLIQHDYNITAAIASYD